MPRHTGPPRGGRDDSHPGAAAYADLQQQVRRIRREVLRTREQTLLVTAEIAATERRLARTLHALADRARADGRPVDAERLDGYARSAERFAEAEQVRADEGAPGGPPE